ncbi:MAG: glycosyltransferase family 2 protein [Clostridia bacterium]|nr:glycosyltransferase family 2 protein [Clostridia bacterium]
MLLYAYQMFYILVAFFRKHKGKNPKNIKQHKYGFIIAARNEANVIAHLIDSIHQQDYPSELVRIFVIADNCTDDTAKVARDAGAVVYERFNQDQVGKGYALDFGLKCIERDFGTENIEGFFIFDADNLLSKNYISKMNTIFDEGYSVVTSYRNSKNFSTNWLTAGYSLWFLRESKYLNNSRMLMDTNCAVSGTGFLVNAEVFKENDGWHYTLLTEDIEFSVDCAVTGRKIGYADAEFYDEQPTTFAQSWSQRMRWAKGFYQVFGQYGKKLVGNWLINFSFSCYDLTMTIFPALFITLACCLTNLCILIYALFLGSAGGDLIGITLSSLGTTVSNFYITVFLVGLLTTITEWKRIDCPKGKKILYLFTFPLFMFTYVPIAIAALFKKVKWDPIAHNVTKKIEDIENQ